MKDKLLTRDEYKEKVFSRDKHTCVFCDNTAVDAHHILDRKLWSDGGYYLSNGASVCEKHHWDFEKVTLTVENVRKACGITKFILPSHFHHDIIYDKWRNMFIDEQWHKGILFEDDGVQKILKKSGLFYLFY
jgi:hypothetical protein